MKKVAGVVMVLSVLMLTYGTVNSQTTGGENKPAVGFSAIGNKVICPVTGEKFMITDNSPRVEYNGKTYFFSSPDCVEKFNKDPEKYLSRHSKMKHKSRGRRNHEKRANSGKMTSDNQEKKQESSGNK